MHNLSHDEVSATHRIFNHVESVIGPYYGRKSRMEAKKYVSKNRWIMFPEYHILSLREGAELPIPNVFVHFPDETVQDNGSGLIDGTLGLTYHNVQAMQWLEGILGKLTEEVLTASQKDLGEAESLNQKGLVLGADFFAAL